MPSAYYMHALRGSRRFRSTDRLVDLGRAGGHGLVCCCDGIRVARIFWRKMYMTATTSNIAMTKVSTTSLRERMM
jgi:hypothetical protein